MSNNQRKRTAAERHNLALEKERARLATMTPTQRRNEVVNKAVREMFDELKPQWDRFLGKTK